MIPWEDCWTVTLGQEWSLLQKQKSSLVAPFCFSSAVLSTATRLSFCNTLRLQRPISYKPWSAVFITSRVVRRVERMMEIVSVCVSLKWTSVLLRVFIIYVFFCGVFFYILCVCLSVFECDQSLWKLSVCGMVKWIWSNKSSVEMYIEIPLSFCDLFSVFIFFSPCPSTIPFLFFFFAHFFFRVRSFSGIFNICAKFVLIIGIKHVHFQW